MGVAPTKCSDVYLFFFEPGEVVEIRAYGLSRSNKAWEGFAGGNGIIYGYFDNADDFGAAAEALDRAGAGSAGPVQGGRRSVFHEKGIRWQAAAG